MGLAWVTSTAITALIVATLVFGWQRNFEHAFLLRKEKREVYRSFLSQLTIVLRVLKKRNLSGEESFIALDVIYHEIRLIGGGQVSLFVHKLLYEMIEFNTANEPPEEHIEEWSEFYKGMGAKSEQLVQLMSDDLEATVSALPSWTNKFKKEKA